MQYPGIMREPKDPTDRFLRLLFQRTVHSVLAAAAVAAGCSDSHQGLDDTVDPGPGQPQPQPTDPTNPVDPGPTDPPNPTDPTPPPGIDTSWREPTCNGNWQHDLAANVNPAFAADYFSVRYSWGPGDEDVISESGVPCDNAVDSQRCERDFSTETGTPSDDQYILTTQGDVVEAWRTVADRLAVLGVIDTHDEAVYVAQLNGYYVQCHNVQDFAVRQVAEGQYEVRHREWNCDPDPSQRVTLSINRDGEMELVATEDLGIEECPVVGRRPPGLCRRMHAVRVSVVGDHFAKAAHDEAASVRAFRVIARELRAHGAPPALVRRARTAAREEVRHARQMRGLARRYGAAYHAPRLEPQPLRSLEAFALDNAVEGCVNETFAALEGAYQSQTAQDPAVREVMAQVAHDETGHAALSWKMAAWAAQQLDAAANARIEAAQREAIARLRRALDRERDGDVQRLAGVPSPEHAHRLLDSLETELFGSQS